jgi:hypothetical protein
MYLAQKDQQAGTGDASIMTTFFAEIAYIVMAIVALLRESTLFELGTVFALIMILGLFIQTVLALAMLREQRRFGNLSI